MDGGNRSQPCRGGRNVREGRANRNGVIVETVPPDSAAARAGLLPGDLLLEVNGEHAGSTDKLKGLTGSCSSGQPLELTGLSNQRKLEFMLSCRD